MKNNGTMNNVINRSVDINWFYLEISILAPMNFRIICFSVDFYDLVPDHH